MPELAKRSDMLATKQDVKEAFERITFVLTIRMGLLVAGFLAATAVLIITK
ncbi:hypothetical protein MRS76_03235 [Rhizobiaceae bacterium n13]|uniref:Uncharacterized protein n=1 Tax=Ferirhizobium litorale TaxID=2927786 RepID=A0AAE3Q8F3_9HYPH|nr:hypothetical protein [Fererhizobium litorale]MDI7860959.1 hypothetical protein [Fererhizobium litorale]MDI7921107.1 hypothetical protein [Fererhizobium litorale]